MKILLTGVNRSGKTTLLQSLLAKLDGEICGFVTAEVRDNTDRIGFDVHNSSGRSAILARLRPVTKHSVARYYVDTDTWEGFILSLPQPQANQLLYVDEIGQMQLCSPLFQSLVEEYLNSENDYIGTISAIYEHPFITAVKQRSDVLLCTVTPENRVELAEVLQVALATRQIFNDLPAAMQEMALNLARNYLQAGQHTSAKKLFKNALAYVSRQRISEVKKPGEYEVRGFTHTHRVVASHDAFLCDCDFFNGRGQFSGTASECSHIQAVKLAYTQ